MSTLFTADWVAGFSSGALGIIVGNPLDIVKVRLQAGYAASGPQASPAITKSPTSFLRGAAAPLLGYGALNALLFATYNRSLKLLEPSVFDLTKLAGVGLSKIWLAGALGGLASWVVSSPSELIKCRAQLCIGGEASSWDIAKSIIKGRGLRGLYLGGMVTNLRDSIGYGFYFWSYELTKRLLLSRQHDPFAETTAFEILIAGGIAGVVTWASIYPLDVVKTRLQTQAMNSPLHEESRPLLSQEPRSKTAIRIAKDIYKHEGLVAFYRGLGVCSARAFVVNAVQASQRVVSSCPADSLQWFTYEKVMAILAT